MTDTQNVTKRVVAQESSKNDKTDNKKPTADDKKKESVEVKALDHISIRSTLTKGLDALTGKLAHPQFHEDEVAQLFLYMRSIWAMIAGIVAGFLPFEGRQVFIVYGGLTYFLLKGFGDRLGVDSSRQIPNSVMPSIIGFTFFWVVTYSLINGTSIQL